MIDIRHFREHPEEYEDSAKRRGLKVDVKAAVELDQHWLDLTAQINERRAELNVSDKPTPEELAGLQAKKQQLEKLGDEYREVEQAREELLLTLPNLVAADTPEGGEEANRSERTWGEAKSNPDIKDHLTLCEANGWIDFERGAKVAGAKFYYLKGPLPKLELAIMRWSLDRLEAQGFAMLSVPHLVNTRIANGTGFLPRGEERQIYQIADEDLNLIATAEMPLTGYHADEILPDAQLPLLYGAVSPSYRREAGAYGKHSRGLYRVHQFDKLEMYVFSRPEESEQWQTKLVAIQEELVQELEIPYQVVRIAAGDLGAPAYQKYDINYWSPVDSAYHELTSCSNVTDFQARRLGIRTKDATGQTRYVHTLNGTAVAFSRTLIALLENHQSADGTVTLPAILQPYYGGAAL